MNNIKVDVFGGKYRKKSGIEKYKINEFMHVAEDDKEVKSVVGDVEDSKASEAKKTREKNAREVEEKREISIFLLFSDKKYIILIF